MEKVNIHDAKTHLSRLVERAEAGEEMSTHAARVASLPALHKDAFDRLRVAQAIAEQALLPTNDSQLGDYGAHVRVV